MSLAIAAALRLTSHLRFARAAVAISASISTTHRARDTNVGTLTTDGAHGLFVGAVVTIADVGTGYDGSKTVLSVPTSTTFTFASTGADEAETADADGTVTQTGDVAETLKPIATATNWLDLGDIEGKVDIDPRAAEPLKRVVARRGKLVTKRQPGPLSEPMIKFKTSQMIDLAAVLALAGNVPSSTQFNPGSGLPHLEGWLKGIHCDPDDDSNRMVWDLYGILCLDSPLSLDPQQFIMPEWRFEISDATLNTVYIN